MHDRTAELASISERVPLKIHKGKAKLFRIQTASVAPINIHNSVLDDIEAFTYLGSVTDKHRGTEADVKERISTVKEHMEVQKICMYILIS